MEAVQLLMPPHVSKVIELHDRGILAFHNGRPEEAEALLKNALTLEPDNIAVLTSYGQFLRNTGRLPEALDTFLRILTLDPANAHVANAVGVCFQETNQPAKAIDHYLRAMTLRPDFADPYNNIGVVLFHEKDFDAAMEHFQQALALNPAYSDAHSNLALVHRNRLDYSQAITSFRRALQLDPDNPKIAAGLGEALSLTCDPSAEHLLRKAVAAQPENPEFHWNLSLELLRRGDYLTGWQEYEWRWKHPDNQTPLRSFPQPFWRGEHDQDIRGATILLHVEQGLGDTIQMLRYVPLLLAQGARVVLELPQPLRQLITEYANTTDGALTIIPAGDPLPAFDCHCSLMSLPLAFRTTLDTIPEPLRLTSPRANAIRRKDQDSLRIGLCWAGNPSHALDRERSLPLEALRPLFSVPGCSFVSLQTGPAARQIESTGLPLAQPALNDFTDTAALIDTLDLVIAVDTAVAHLSASQGAPTWILLPFISDWRWLQPGARAENPWYPCARIFRQTSFAHTATSPVSPADRRPLWDPVVGRLVAALDDFARAR
jgi:tetratricopeptide (TPR) repeat protein